MDRICASKKSPIAKKKWWMTHLSTTRFHSSINQWSFESLTGMISKFNHNCRHQSATLIRVTMAVLEYFDRWPIIQGLKSCKILNYFSLGIVLFQKLGVNTNLVLFYLYV